MVSRDETPESRGHHLFRLVEVLRNGARLVVVELDRIRQAIDEGQTKLEVRKEYPHR
jgi:hypothetical protein